MDVSSLESELFALARAEGTAAFADRLADLLGRRFGAQAVRLRPADAAPAAGDHATLTLTDGGQPVARVELYPPPADVEALAAIAEVAGSAYALVRRVEAAEARAARAEEERGLLEAALRATLQSGEGAVLLGPGDEVRWSAGQGAERLRSDPPGRRSPRWRTREVLDLPEYRLLIPYDPDRRIERRAERARAAWGLTPAQTTVVGHLARGLSNKEIANLLDITEATVEAHLTAIFRASGETGRAAVVARFWALI